MRDFLAFAVSHNPKVMTLKSNCCLHECMNLAGLWDIPVIYIVENNGYSMGTSIERGTTMAHNLLAKGAAYGIDSLKITEEEGLDILKLYDKFKPFADADFGFVGVFVQRLAFDILHCKIGLFDAAEFGGPRFDDLCDAGVL